MGAYAAGWLVLLSSLGARWKDVHVIGGSLGGQAAGMVGSAAARAGGGGRIGRITALDPSGPLFHAARREDRLDDRSDGFFLKNFSARLLF